MEERLYSNKNKGLILKRVEKQFKINPFVLILFKNFLPFLKEL